jgi:hypothetical protein
MNDSPKVLGSWAINSYSIVGSSNIEQLACNNTTGLHPFTGKYANQYQHV